MAVFRYQGINKAGKKAVGMVDADNERAARMKLRKMQVYPTLVAAGAGGMMAAGQQQFSLKAMFQKIKPQDISLMTRQMASLLNAGVPLVDTLSALSEQLENPKLANALTDIRNRVTEGEKFSETLSNYPQIFNDLYVNMVAAGEASGNLEKVLGQIADVTEAQAVMRAKIVGALTYPAIMGIVGVVMMIMLVTFVVPKMTEMLIDMEVPLPLPTRFLIGTTDFIFAWWWLMILGIGLGIWSLRRWSVTPRGKAKIDETLLKLPLIGKLLRLATVARMTGTLGTLLRGGVPLLAAMDIVKNVVSNTVLKAVLVKTRDAVKEGASLADPLRESGEFPKLATQMIAIGEKTGELEQMLERVAKTYETEVDNTVGSLMGLIEPVMLIGMGGMVAFIVISVMGPMLTASQTMMNQ